MENEKVAFILIGPAGCGKSTWAQEKMVEDKKICLLSSDAVRQHIMGREDDISNDSFIWTVIEKKFSDFIAKGKDFIFDATNYTVSSRGKFVREALNAGYKVVAVDCFSGLDIEEVKRRNANRRRKVPEFVIEKMVSKFVKPSYQEGFSNIIQAN